MFMPQVVTLPPSAPPHPGHASTALEEEERDRQQVDAPLLP